MNVEEEARKRALEHVAKLVQRPDQLDRIGEMKKKSERKKAAVEAMLRTGVQSQLEGIRTAIAQLRSAADDVVAVETEATRIRESLKPFLALQRKMAALREWSERHDQYAAAIENLRLIVEMHEIVAESRTALMNGKLLLVHKNIMDLERARDELMYEVHKLNSATAEKDKKSLLMLFKDVDDLVLLLWKEIGSILKRCLVMTQDAERKEGPTILVSVLRIIEREQRIDQYYKDRQIPMNKFMPPGRPRNWKDAALSIIGLSVRERVIDSQIEDNRATEKAWLARSLECTRIHVVADLLMARNLSATCFPPDYQMYDRFVGMYHESVQRKLQGLIEDDRQGGLQKAEIVQLLKWIKEYTNDKLLGDRRLNLSPMDIVAEDPLLPPPVMVQMQEKFLEMTRDDMKMWLARTIEQEKDDWYKDVKVDVDGEGKFYSPLPSILFGMLEDTLMLAKEFSMDVLPHVIDMAMVQFLPFIRSYQDAAMAFKTKHFEDRNRFAQFTKTMIAVANNMMSCAELTEKYLRQIRLSMEEETAGSRGGMRRHDVIEHITKVVDAWHAGSTAITSVLFEEVMLDLNKHLAEIFTRKWLECTADPMRIIVETLRDYHEDHAHLKSAILLYLAQRIHLKVVGEYLRAIESNRLPFKALAERQKAAELLKDNAEGIDYIFKHYVPQEEQAQFTPLQTILHSVADVLALTDKSLIELETANFARRFPNCPVDVLAALLMAREDVGRAEAKEKAESCLSHTAHHPRDAAFGELFESARADAPSWMMAAGGTRVADVHAATSKLASMLKRGVGDG
ncbi:sec-6 [Pristionchus pacificus]|nr:sec-6 [Pristionchus pacificus]